jgi:7-cyano-7-deazaguanine synthase
MILQQQFINYIGPLHQNKSGILLSGGIDSIALAFLKRPDHSFTINYGQKAAMAEIHAAMQVSKILGIEHHIIDVDCSKLGSGEMSGNSPISIAPVAEWWPYRNQLIITLACMKGVNFGITKLYVGSVKTDSSHKDGTKDFYKKISKLMRYQEGNISIESPAIDLTTLELIKKSKVPNSILLWAHSCHTSNEPCMYCAGCLKYLYTMQKIGIDK